MKVRFIRLIIVAGLSVTGILGVLSPAFGQNFRIGKVSVCRNALKDISTVCAEIPPPYSNLNRGVLQSGRIYVALLLVCERDALSFLTDNGFLPVNVSIWKNGERGKGDIPIGMSQEHWDENGAAYQALFASQGNFTWRTWFNVGVADTVEFEITDYRKSLVYLGRDPARFTLNFAN